MILRRHRRATLAALALTAASALSFVDTAKAQDAGEVNIYTTREPGLIQPLLDRFTAETGIATNVVFVQEGLAQRVEAEGENSPADLLSVVDYGNLIEFVDRGLTQPVDSPAVDEAVPENLRDPAGNWFAVSIRARVIYAAKDLDIGSFTYEQLADPEWRDRVCIRSGQHPYNTSLFAAMIAKDGIDSFRSWLEAVHENLARQAGGGDRDVARDILAGICDIGVGNSYYVGLMRSGTGGEEQVAWGDAIKVILPTFADGLGTHVNVSGVAVARHAPNRENALKLIEFMVSEEGQHMYAEANFEYPVRAGVALDPIIAALGPLTIDPLPLSQLADHRVEASLIVDEVGFDN